MIEPDNDKKSPKKSTYFFNLTSLLVVLISLFFTYQHLSKPNEFDKIVHQNDKEIKQNVNNKDESTFLDKFKKEIDLSAFIDKSSTNDQNGSFNPTIIDQFNNHQLLPRLLSVVDMDYFKYVKLNLKKKCTLWSDDAKCSRKDCTIQTCDESRLPDYIINTDENELREHHKHFKEDLSKECIDEQINNTASELDQIVNVISNETISTMNELFECYVSEYEDGEFYDLKMNPEQFTGYKGKTAHRIWRSIYEENCFKSKKIYQLTDQKETNTNSAQSFESILNVDDLCLEEKIFYRTISGLHTSINIHLSRYYHFKDGSIGFNLKEFYKRFEG